MKTPNSTLELSAAIESLITTYMDSVHNAAEQAVMRALAKPRSSTRRPTRTSQPSKAKQQAAAAAARRTSEEVSLLCDALCARVASQPGVSMVELAEQMSANVRSLQVPMAKLKAAGQVRSVGQRQRMRYYPAVLEASGNEV